MLSAVLSSNNVFFLLIADFLPDKSCQIKWFNTQHYNIHGIILSTWSTYLWLLKYQPIGRINNIKRVCCFWVCLLINDHWSISLDLPPSSPGKGLSDNHFGMTNHGNHTCMYFLCVTHVPQGRATCFLCCRQNDQKQNV